MALADYFLFQRPSPGFYVRQTTFSTPHGLCPKSTSQTANSQELSSDGQGSGSPTWGGKQP